MGMGAAVSDFSYDGFRVYIDHGTVNLGCRQIETEACGFFGRIEDGGSLMALIQAARIHHAYYHAQEHP